jgi:hypothetical protein
MLNDVEKVKFYSLFISWIEKNKNKNNIYNVLQPYFSNFKKIVAPTPPFRL